MGTSQYTRMSLPERPGRLHLSLGRSKTQPEIFRKTSISRKSTKIPSISKNHPGTLAILQDRYKKLDIIRNIWETKGAKVAMNKAMSFDDSVVMVDLLSVLVMKPTEWDLDLCLLLLPLLGELL